MNKLVKFLPFLSLGAFAQEGQSPIDQISASLGTQMTTWSTSITSFFTTNIGTIMGVVGIGIAIALVWVALRLFRKATSKAS